MRRTLSKSGTPAGGLLKGARKMSREWSDKKYLREARREPERLAFWLPYSRDILDASKSVCDNPPSLDMQFREVFPNPARYKKERAQEAKVAARRRAVGSKLPHLLDNASRRDCRVSARRRGVIKLPIDLAYEYVSSIVDKADRIEGCGPMWFGWAVREAFVAGFKAALKASGAVGEQSTNTQRDEIKLF
jgi:hypothetical protein